MSLALIAGIAGPSLSAYEKSFYRALNPWGFIVMGRNCVSRAQLSALTKDLRASVGCEAMIFIDQEGGRVARLKAPEWPTFPPAARFAALYHQDPQEARDLCFLNHRLMAAELREIGVNADCAPVLDLPVVGAHPIIGDRAFGTDPQTVIELGRAALAGLKAGGVAGVIKHIPGHGRANVDSHDEAPTVSTPLPTLRRSDFVPFKALAAEAAMAMTAHIVYDGLDAERVLTFSPTAIARAIRGDIGFDGALMSDDLRMSALDGRLEDRGHLAIQAGCDLALYCGAVSGEGIVAELEALAAGLPMLQGEALRRTNRAMAEAQAPLPFDSEAAWAKLRAAFAAPAALG